MFYNQCQNGVKLVCIYNITGMFYLLLYYKCTVYILCKLTTKEMAAELPSLLVLTYTYSANYNF